ncbi:MAG: amino acid permease family protein [Bacteroidetes bacterium]|jgi:APA family basic amino acid/polyamine antiporter|nr:amino acid permease family protein [Bacteroidota bacterium]
MQNRQKLGFYTAVSLVIANMVGTGVFTSLGFQLYDIKSPFAIVSLWLVGGIVALCGALTYGEIGVVLPRSGGEYNYLSKIYHPLFGFLSGWVSVTVGFAAPVALAAMALGNYVNKIFPDVNPIWLALIVVGIITVIHATNLKLGSGFQRFFTLLKVVVIVFFIGAGFFIEPDHITTILPQQGSWKEIFSPAFAVSLIYVSYAYSGWNAASYLAEEIENPRKNLPRSLFIGTLVVTVLYVLLNFIFMYTVPTETLTGYVEVGYLSAVAIFGAKLGNMMGLVIALLLVSSISAMIMAGPRITKTMGEDLHFIRFLSRTNKNQVPFVAVILQSVITVVLILTAQFESVLTFIGFSLNLFTFFTVLGIFIIRSRKMSDQAGYKTFGYPVVPIIYLALTIWMMYFVMTTKPVESLYGLLNVGVGALVWFLGTRLGAKPKVV